MRKYIVDIHLYHFQGYLNEHIQFNENSTAILGETDSGKSTITRALYWCLYNKPTRGIDSWITRGRNHCFVTVTFNTNEAITRGRRDEENYYRVQCLDGTTQEFKGFGFDVPEEVLRIHGMPLLEPDPDTAISLNISQQLEPVFLFSEAGSKRAKVVGIISEADKIDGGIGVLSGWHKQDTTKIKELNKQVKDKTKILETYSHLETVKEDLDNVEILFNTLDKNKGYYNSLSETLSTYDNLNTEYTKLTLFTQYASNIITLEELCLEVSRLYQTIQELQVVQANYVHLKDTETNLTFITSYADQIDVLSSDLDNLSNLLTTYNTLSQLLSQYSSLIQDKTTLITYASYTDSMKELEIIFQEVTNIQTNITLLENLLKEYNNLLLRRDNGVDFINQLTVTLETLEEHYSSLLKEVGKCPFCASSL